MTESNENLVYGFYDQSEDNEGFLVGVVVENSFLDVGYTVNWLKFGLDEDKNQAIVNYDGNPQCHPDELFDHLVKVSTPLPLDHPSIERRIGEVENGKWRILHDLQSIYDILKASEL